MTETNSTSNLTQKQELFCKLFASDREFFGNGVQSYIEAYDPDTSKKGWYNTACARASQLLSNVKVLDRINELLELRGLNDSFVDKQLELLITQNADLKTKIAAIREYNSLKQRITQKIKVEGDPVKDILEGFGLNVRETQGDSEASSPDNT